MRRLSILFLLLSAPVWATISSSTVWEVRQNGSDTNGGGYVSTGTDYSVNANKNASGCSACGSATDNLSTTDAVAAGTTTITSASANFQTSIIGNIIYLAGGTGSLTGTWRQVTARASTTSITVDATVATGTGITMNIGGALASPGIVSAMPNFASGMIIYVKYSATPYAITSASIGVSGGVIQTGMTVRYIGYDTTRTAGNTDANRPTLQLASGVASATVITLTTPGTPTGYNLIADCNGQTTSRGFNINSSYGSHARLKAMNCTNGGIVTASGQHLIHVEVAGCSSQVALQMAYPGSACVNCEIHDNSVTGANGGGMFINTLSYNNTGRGFELIATANNINSNWITGAAYNNTSGYAHANLTGNPLTSILQITAGSVFTNATAGDFSLNNIAGRGAALRAAATLSNTFPRGLTVGYRDIGAAQHQDPAGGGTSGGSYTFVGKNEEPKEGSSPVIPYSAGGVAVLAIAYLAGKLS